MLIIPETRPRSYPVTKRAKRTGEAQRRLCGYSTENGRAFKSNLSLTPSKIVLNPHRAVTYSELNRITMQKPYVTETT